MRLEVTFLDLLSLDTRAEVLARDTWAKNPTIRREYLRVEWYAAHVRHRLRMAAQKRQAAGGAI